MGVFGWSLPPGCGVLPGEEDEWFDNRVVSEAFPEASGPGELARQTYKYNACGPVLGAVICYWEEQDDGGFAVRKHRTVYGEALNRLGTWDDLDNVGALVVGFTIGSIVEGVDYECETIEVKVDPLEDDPQTIAYNLSEAIGTVCSQAQEIWNDTHGCDNCAILNGGTTEEGYIAVHPDCPECGGCGVVI